jgi:hypothetical protein
MTNDTAKALLQKIMEKRASWYTKFLDALNTPKRNPTGDGEVSSWFPNDRNPLRPTISGKQTESPFFDSASRFLNPANWMRNTEAAVEALPTADQAFNAVRSLTPSKVYGGIKSWTDALRHGTPDQRALDEAIANSNAAAVKQQELGNLIQAGKYGLGIGAGLGGLAVLPHMLPKFESKKKKENEEEINIPYPVARTKTSAESWLSYITGAGKRLPSVLDNPLLIPGSVALGGLGIYGALKGSNKLTKAILEKNEKEETQKAKDEFKQVLLDSYDKPLSYDPTIKESSDMSVMEKISREIDVLFELVKTADPATITDAKGLFDNTPQDRPHMGLSTGNLPRDVASSILPLYLTYALGSGLGAGALAYGATRKNSKAEALKLALKERARAKYEQSPPELYAIPEAVDISAREKRPSSVV